MTVSITIVGCIFKIWFIWSYSTSVWKDLYHYQWSVQLSRHCYDKTRPQHISGKAPGNFTYKFAR